MGRTYAGILGPLAFAVTVAHGLIEGDGAEGTLKLACLLLFAFAALGYLLGRAATVIVDDSVRSGFRKEFAEFDADGQTKDAARK